MLTDHRARKWPAAPGPPMVPAGGRHAAASHPASALAAAVTGCIRLPRIGPPPRLLHVCSAVPVPFDSARYQATAESRTERHGPAFSGTRRTQNSGLLICGFGVRVPGGAPILNWGFTLFGSPREGHFRPMFAPRLLVSPDLVARRLIVLGSTPSDVVTDSEARWQAGQRQSP
jgi:hypothetical protein